VVAPTCRGQGIGAQLIEALLTEGQSLLGLSQASLFVLSDNKAAIKLYNKSGFVEAEYSKEIPLEKCLYMTRSAATFEKLD